MNQIQIKWHRQPAGLIRRAGEGVGSCSGQTLVFNVNDAQWCLLDWAVIVLVGTGPERVQVSLQGVRPSPKAHYTPFAARELTPDTGCGKPGSELGAIPTEDHTASQSPPK